MVSLKKVKSIFPYVYIASLAFLVTFITISLKHERLSVTNKVDDDKKVEEVKPIRVSIKIISPAYTLTYDKKLENTNTFEDLLDNLRKEEGLTYEKTSYTYGSEYSPGSDINSKWRIYENDEEITYETDHRRLVDEAEYRIETTQSAELQ